MKYPLKKWAKKRPNSIIQVFFLCLNLSVQGQLFRPEANHSGLGDIYTLRKPGAFPTENPATLGGQNGCFLGLAHCQPFLVREIAVVTLEGLFPVYPGNFHLQLSNFGLQGYQNIYWSLGYGMILNDRISAGISFKYYQTIAEGEWNYLWKLGTSAGIIYSPSEKTSIAFHILNPVTFGNYRKTGKVFPSIISSGIAHELYSDLWILTEISAYSSGKLQYKVAFSYAVKAGIELQLGYHSLPHSLTFGLVLNKGKMSVQSALSWSIVPGLIPAIQIRYSL